MLGLALGVLLPRYGRYVGEVDLMAEFGLVFVAVDGEEVGAQDDEDGFPGLIVLSAQLSMTVGGL